MTEPPATLPQVRRHPIVPNVIESLALHRLVDGRHVLRLFLPGHPTGDHLDLDYRADDPDDNRARLLMRASRQINAGTELDAMDYPPLFVGAMTRWALYLDGQAMLMALHGCDAGDVATVRRWADQLLGLFMPDSLKTHYRCPRCQAVSYNPGDVTHRYCGRCHQFEDDMMNAKEN